MISQKLSITFTIDGNVIVIIYIGEIEIHTVLMYHCASYSVRPCPLLIVLYLALAAKILDTPDLYYFLLAHFILQCDLQMREVIFPDISQISILLPLFQCSS